MTASAPVAGLPMYDLPELRAATDALWRALASALRARGVTAPDALDRRTAPMTLWTAPGLALAQTCGWPFVTALRGRVALAATPCYAVPGTEGPRYRSAVLVRADDPAQALADLRGRRLAANGPDSWSGCHALRALAAPLAVKGRFFGSVQWTGAHRASMAAVAAGRADAAAVDCVTLGLLARAAPAETACLRALAWTDPAPGLPLITRADPAAVADALAAVVADPAVAPAMAALSLTGFAPACKAGYAVLQARARAADAAGYPALA